jgi:hypothetical protein
MNYAPSSLRAISNLEDIFFLLKQGLASGADFKTQGLDIISNSPQK